MTQAKARSGQGELQITPEQALEEFRGMALQIPEEPDDDGTGILVDILTASDFDNLSSTWDDKDEDKLIGERLRFLSVARRESDFREGLGIYLVCQVVRVETGEHVRFQTSSGSVIAQLTKAWVMGAFPFQAILKRAEKATKRGYFPLHLEVVKGTAGKG